MCIIGDPRAGIPVLKHIQDGMYVCMYVCIVITYSKSMDQPGKVANPTRGELNREN